MWWQPENSGLDMDQWAIDELLVSGYGDLRNVDDDFDGKPVTLILPLRFNVTITAVLVNEFYGDRCATKFGMSVSSGVSHASILRWRRTSVPNIFSGPLLTPRRLDLEDQTPHGNTCG